MSTRMFLYVAIVRLNSRGCLHNWVRTFSWVSTTQHLILRLFFLIFALTCYESCGESPAVFSHRLIRTFSWVLTRGWEKKLCRKPAGSYMDICVLTHNSSRECLEILCSSVRSVSSTMWWTAELSRMYSASCPVSAEIGYSHHMTLKG